MTRSPIRPGAAGRTCADSSPEARGALGHEFRAFTGLTPTRYVEVRRRFLRDHPGHVLDSWPLPGRLHSSKSDGSRHANLGAPQAEESAVGKVVMYSSVSVDGFVADEHDQPGPLFDWLQSGDVPLD